MIGMQSPAGDRIQGRGERCEAVAVGAVNGTLALSEQIDRFPPFLARSVRSSPRMRS